MPKTSIQYWRILYLNCLPTQWALFIIVVVIDCIQVTLQTLVMKQVKLATGKLHHPVLFLEHLEAYDALGRFSEEKVTEREGLHCFY